MTHTESWTTQKTMQEYIKLQKLMDLPDYLAYTNLDPLKDLGIDHKTASHRDEQALDDFYNEKLS